MEWSWLRKVLVDYKVALCHQIKIVHYVWDIICITTELHHISLYYCVKTQWRRGRWGCGFISIHSNKILIPYKIVIPSANKYCLVFISCQVHMPSKHDSSGQNSTNWLFSWCSDVTTCIWYQGCDMDVRITPCLFQPYHMAYWPQTMSDIW